MPSRFEPATGNPRLNGVVVDADDKTGRAIAIRRISYSEQELTQLEAGAARDLQTSSSRP
jgi:calcineurin-like phosphoesterase